MQPVGDFLEVNDLENANQDEEEIEIQQPEIPQPPEGVNLMALADEQHDIPHLPAFPAMIDEEIGLNQLIDDMFELPDNIEVEQPFVQEPINKEQIMMQQLGPEEQEEQSEMQQLVPGEFQVPRPIPVPEQEHENHHLQVGMALMPEFQFGAAFRDWEVRKKTSEATKLWEGLVQQDNFGWTKEFLTSGATTFLAENSDESTWKEQSSLSQEVASHLDLDLSLSSGGAKKKRTLKRPTPVVETEFCKMGEEDLLEENLLQKKEKMEPVSRKRSKTKAGKKDNADQGGSEERAEAGGGAKN